MNKPSRNGLPNALGKPSKLFLGAAAFGLAATSPVFSQSEVDDEDEVFTLSPFTVSAGEDSGYDAKHTLAGTRVRTELKDVGSAISVMTEQFLEDTGSTNAEEALVYANNTEVVGQGGNFLGGQRTPNIGLPEASTVAGTRVRGLESADNLRDFFLSSIPWDSYNVDRVDLQRGANSVLFGIGSAAGIINTSVIDPFYQNETEVELKFDNFGSMRMSADINRVLFEDELAVRVAILRDDKKYQQDSAFREDERLFVAAKWEPKFLRNDSDVFSLSANFETGDIDRNDVVLTPPVDLITPWFNDMGQLTVDYLDSSGLDGTSPFIGKNPYSHNGAAIALYPFGESTQWGYKQSNGLRGVGATDQNPGLPVEGNGHHYGVADWVGIALGMELPGSSSGKTVNKSLTDRRVFDFYNDHLYGPNKGQTQEFNTYNLGLTKTFFNGDLAFNVIYDNQSSRHDSYRMTGINAIAVDFYETLPDGSANPFLGMPYLPGSKDAPWTVHNNDRETLRATMTGELDFAKILDSDSMLSNILGRHVFTGAYSDYEETSWGYGAGESYYTDLSYAVTGVDIDLARDDRRIMGQHYLSNVSMLGLSSASQATIHSLNVMQSPTPGQIVQWDAINGNKALYDVPAVNNYTSANRRPSWAYDNRNEIESQTAVWQGYLLGGNLVPMVGWREDTFDPYQISPLVGELPETGGFFDLSQRDPNAFTFLGDQAAEGQTHTFSVVGHVPQNWVEKIPGVSGLRAHYNESENFRPGGIRRGVLGEYMPLQTGETTEVGISAEFMEGKYRLKINKYESNIANANSPTPFSQAWALNYEFWNLGAAYGMKKLIETGETWHMPVWGNAALLGPLDSPNGWGTTSEGSKYGAGNTLWWGPPSDLATTFVDTPAGVTEAEWPQAVVDEWYDLMVDSIDAWIEMAPPEGFQDAWNMNDRQDPDAFSPWSMSGQGEIRPIANTSSEGYEIEFIANPIEGLNISMTLAQTEAIATDSWSNMGWLAERYEQLVTTPLGAMMMWDTRDWIGRELYNDTALNRWVEFIMNDYWLATELDGAVVPELREWSGNITANYFFKDGALKGTNWGGSVRYLDKSNTGFAFNEVFNEDLGVTEERYDITRPYYAPSETKFDFWVGYERTLSDNIDWKVQLNVRNVFADKDLIPVTVQSFDGSAGQFRIPEPRTVSISNSFSF
ncbi:TonB-dependent receptor plug domain-containing protein [Pelagicoccus mobilis]|uniref:TonB-dependent receptor plug domain-containing protein n=1 Tax=Pelagicoccus mobilis TaxID=415221 RepID=A0A934VSJ0_9BACT|nr:TonB-dependent receptor plug domain-containing protein [Pelagicoccus mobilis]MBK1878723.1 TonB-dependent receptor plug domain-containing protein [Pelagicoccus mobilis]